MRRLPERSRAIDAALTEEERALPFLRSITPTNLDEAWAAFQSSGFARAPDFELPQLPDDPAANADRVAALPVETAEHPILVRWFRAQRDSLVDRWRILAERGQSGVLPRSRRVFGTTSPSLLDEARRLLSTVDDDPVSSQRSIDAQRFARIADRAIARYRQMDSRCIAGIEVRPMASRAALLSGDVHIAADLSISETEARALIAHEVDTHLVTLWNGRVQPISLLSAGLAGYDATQEGLAVLAEALVGALTRNRLRRLAARVVAVSVLESGGTFMDIFDELRRVRLDARDAFGVTVRATRAGGSTKDSAYLRGALEVQAALQAGAAITALHRGKFPASALGEVDSLAALGWASEPIVAPAFLGDAAVGERLDRIREGAGLETMAAN